MVSGCHGEPNALLCNLSSLTWSTTLANQFQRLVHELCHKKTCLQDLRSGPTQTRLYIDILDLESRGICVAKTKAVIAPDLSLWFLHMQKSKFFSHDGAQKVTNPP